MSSELLPPTGSVIIFSRIRLKRETYEKLLKEAKKEFRKPSEMVRVIVERYFEEGKHGQPTLFNTDS